ncbi:DUF262 domain-containing protein [Lichenifustis flavocetrariae]|uniref:DUF262 domain-containing HNH endonuclease family protein n=1 Tax=Lichenifustis flavocetrariae TaxID=2949735 RepID=A0AA42CJL6_9HYPH|nr:DUF262 domain-containing protein [Lichenifustis flavocetrariae]MCW6509693.1 DUF262 domain-containing HNH endonuclease family protein [Lichenifustis flavocetrariae]
MEVNKTPVLTVFDVKQRLEVPLFQRQYVWNEEQQWTPLWEDIERKFCEVLEGRTNAPHHFLGAMVLDQKQTPTGHVVVRQVIDGQQRLTTLQIFLAAFRDFCRSQGCQPLAAECEKFILNTGMMANPEVDKFKVWPTQLDRPQFIDVTTAGSRAEILKRHPLKKKPYARKPDPRPRMIEAYLFFFAQLEAFFLGEEGQELTAASIPLATRTDECFQALRNALMVVVIDLQKDDDPQVIFETLNARGEPLLPADLLRNYIFFRAAREKLVIEVVYQKYWSGFDEEFWRQEVSQGRLYRPRSDLFMQHFLSSRQGRDVPIKHLYVEYKHWLEATKPFAGVEAELQTLSRQRDDFRRIIAPAKDDLLFGLSTFLDTFDVRTTYPLLLAMLDAKTDDDELLAVCSLLESYVLRRAVCDLTTKNYNRVFLSLSRNLRENGFTAANLKSALLALSGDSALWPNDAVFRDAWLREPLYTCLNNARLVYILTRLNQTFLTSKIEMIAFEKQPTVEHLLPRSWRPNWPLQDGSKGMELSDMLAAPPSDARAQATRRRDEVLQTIGNLTIITMELNSAQSNSAWSTKRFQLGIHSILPINQSAMQIETWNETAIQQRGEALFARALTIWPR